MKRLLIKTTLLEKGVCTKKEDKQNRVKKLDADQDEGNPLLKFEVKPYSESD